MLDSYSISPFKPVISLHKVLDELEMTKNNQTGFQQNYVQSLIEEINKYPELLKGIENIELLDQYEDRIKILLGDLFPYLLSENEIKAVTIPFHLKILNLTKRLERILADAGGEFNLNLRDFSDHDFYVMNCCVIIKTYFNYPIEITDTPLFIDIPDANEITRHYRVLFNSDFMEIIPTENSKLLTPEEIRELLDNKDDLALWKEKFPEKSWILKGFSIMTLFDATIENALSTFKGNLLSEGNNKLENVEGIFKSIFKIPQLKIGFTLIGNFLQKLNLKVMEEKYFSHLLNESSIRDCEALFDEGALRNILRNRTYWAISDIDNCKEVDPEEQKLLEILRKQNVKSFILVPIFDEDKLLGILELSSQRVGDFNSVNAFKLNYILPFIQDKLSHVTTDLENEIEAIIQNEYTSIHPSVLWRFKEEAFEFIRHKRLGLEYALKEIVFHDVYPLYGQIDVQGSSNSRNQAIQKDLILQVQDLIHLFELIYEKAGLPLFEQKIYELKNYLQELKLLISSNTEQLIQNYISTEIHTILNNYKSNSSDRHIRAEIDYYFEKTIPLTGVFYQERREFDESISIINKKLAMILDEKQKEAQSYFPHYYERFKTDGVEHSMYIGASIVPDKGFHDYYLRNLRLWELQVMCEMENYFYKLRPTLPHDLDVSSLILVFGSPISIRFRMDEKQFDIDGSYNVRYEIVKKRIDKAKIKNSEERITQPGKLTIIYQNREEEKEYLNYIKLMQHKGMLDLNIENLEVEDLQGIIGLKALRVGFIYHESEKVYTDFKIMEN